MALEEDVQELRKRLGELQRQLADPLLQRLDELEKLRIEFAVNTALLRLLCEDNHLLQIDAHERSITYRLAMYLRGLLPDWDVDCEYNRNLEDPKRDTKGAIVVPDIIVHRRRTKRNLLAIEVKKSGSPRESDEQDREKLRGYRCEYGYKHTLFLKLKTGNGGVGIEPLEWIE